MRPQQAHREQGALGQALEKVSEVSRTSQIPPCDPALEDLTDLGESGGHASEDEEDDIIIELDEPERMNPKKRARIVHQQTQEQLANRTVKVGYHHGIFNPLPSSWKYPPGLTVIQLINLWLVGSEKEFVPPLRKLHLSHVRHFDKRGRARSKMKIVMHEVEYFARLQCVWVAGRWTSPAVTKMWSAIWPHLEPHLRTLTPCEKGGTSHEKSRQGQISWRTCYNKLVRHGTNWLPYRENVAGRAVGEIVPT